MRPTASAADVVAAVAALDAAHADTVFVGIDGRGLAGKTTLAARIAAEVPATVVVHVDDFSPADVPEWDWRRFGEQVVRPLLAGRAATYDVTRWDGTTDDPVSVEPGGVVVVEGVSSTRAEAGVPWALTVWVEAALDVRRRRACERDGEALLNVWEHDWMPSEEAYVAREHPDRRADLFVDGTIESS